VAGTPLVIFSNGRRFSPIEPESLEQSLDSSAKAEEEVD
tara:strand:- start:20881 stop:20997 length:117 start_codon:yes stop_codon:yes gene_type:complete